MKPLCCSRERVCAATAAEISVTRPSKDARPCSATAISGGTAFTLSVTLLGSENSTLGPSNWSESRSSWCAVEKDSEQFGRAACRERGCKSVEIEGVDVSLKKKTQ